MRASSIHPFIPSLLTLACAATWGSTAHAQLPPAQPLAATQAVPLAAGPQRLPPAIPSNPAPKSPAQSNLAAPPIRRATGKPQFTIPFSLDRPAEEVSEVRLLVSQNRGQQWHVAGRLKPEATHFPFRANLDGVYWFASRTVDRQGVAWPQGPIRAELEVWVDTTRPQLDVQLTSLPRGTQVTWSAWDPLLSPNTLRLDYLHRGQWKTAQATPKAVGRRLEAVAVIPANATELRAIVADQAGNQALVERKLTQQAFAQRTPAKQAAQPAARRFKLGAIAGGIPSDPMQTLEGAATEPTKTHPSDPLAQQATQVARIPSPTNTQPPATTHSPDADPYRDATPSAGWQPRSESFASTKERWSHPASSQAAPRVARGDTLQANASTASPSAAAQPSSGAGAARTGPFPTTHPTAHPAVTSPISPVIAGRSAAINNTPNNTPNNAPVAELPVVPSAVQSDSRGAAFPPSKSDTPPPWRAASSSSSPSSPSSPSAPPSIPSMPSTPPPPAMAIGENPRDSAASATSRSSLPREDIQWSNRTRFSIDYVVDSIAQQNVGGVELWVTTDGGNKWSRWGTDPDQVSPVSVKIDNDGVYGFKVVVVSRQGMASPTPKSADHADVWVGVDTTAPAAELVTARAGKGLDAGKLEIQWKAEDVNLTRSSVSLYYSPATHGPWTPIVTEIANDSRYLWQATPSVPKKVYLKIRVVDTAGNVAEHSLDQAVEVDNLLPRANIRAIVPRNEAASAPPATPAFSQPGSAPPTDPAAPPSDPVARTFAPPPIETALRP